MTSTCKAAKVLSHWLFTAILLTTLHCGSVVPVSSSSTHVVKSTCAKDGRCMCIPGRMRLR